MGSGVCCKVKAYGWVSVTSGLRSEKTMTDNHSFSMLLTVDVEDWFQVENFKPWVPRRSWDGRELRVEKNCHHLMDLFDSFSEVKVRATFFILGWVAMRLPGLVREIHQRGHEVASHGFDHDLCTALSRKALLADLHRSRECLEETIGCRVNGYRAPSFAIDNEILSLIEQSGYRYDSSFNSFDGHGRYGTIDITGKKRNGIAVQFSDTFYELPVSNFLLKHKVIPLGGGGYFRLFPFFLFKYGVRQVLKREKAFVFYLHPWEIDPDQPRVTRASAGCRFRHYIHLDKTKQKLTALMASFRHCKFHTCSGFLGLQK